MVTPYDGGPAFPGACADGMSYRMWLVGLALPGLMAQPQDSERSFEETAAMAVRQADAAIAAQGLKGPHTQGAPLGSVGNSPVFLKNPHVRESP
jgi:hypothetical protein